MNPRNVGEIENASASGTVGNPKCGDIMKADLLIKDGIVKMEVQDVRLRICDRYKQAWQRK